MPDVATAQHGFSTSMDPVTTVCSSIPLAPTTYGNNHHHLSVLQKEVGMKALSGPIKKALCKFYFC
jgi:hypothetical protein